MPLLWTLQKAQPTLLPSHCPPCSWRGKYHLLRPFPGSTCPTADVHRMPCRPCHPGHNTIITLVLLVPPPFTHGPAAPIAESLPLKSRVLLFLQCPPACLLHCRPGTGLFLCPEPASQRCSHRPTPPPQLPNIILQHQYRSSFALEGSCLLSGPSFLDTTPFPLPPILQGLVERRFPPQSFPRSSSCNQNHTEIEQPLLLQYTVTYY